MYHQLTLIGNLGKEPETRFTPSGQQVTNFSVACNRKYTTASGEQVKETVWYAVSTWGKLAENCEQYLHKGSKVYVAGRLTPDKATGRPRIWKTKDDEPRADYEVNATLVLFLDGAQHVAEAQSMIEAAQALGGVPSDDAAADIPF